MSFVGKVRTPWSNLKNHKALFQIPGDNKKRVRQNFIHKKHLISLVYHQLEVYICFFKIIKRHTTGTQRWYFLTIVYQVTFQVLCKTLNYLELFNIILTTLTSLNRAF